MCVCVCVCVYVCVPFIQIFCGCTFFVQSIQGNTSVFVQKEVYININRKIEICIHSNITNRVKSVCSEGLLKMLQIFIFISLSRRRNDSLSSTLPNESLDSLSDSPDSEPVVNDEGNIKSRELPYPFKIKESMIRNSMLLKLNKKLTLTASERLYIFMGIYDECIKFT